MYRTKSLFYVQDEVSLSKKWFLTPGLRLSYHKTHFTLPRDSVQSGLFNEVDLSFRSITSSVGILYRFHPGLRFSILFSQGFRAPNLSDLSKLGESKGTVYEIPNPDLKPEQTHNLDLGLKYISAEARAELVLYYTRLSDLLSSADAALNGMSTITIAEQVFKLKSKQNIGSGYISGLEASFDRTLPGNMAMRGQVTYTYGQNRTLNEPIGGIPPLFGLFGVRLASKKTIINAYLRFASSQQRLSADDLDDLRIPQGGTPGWYTVNVRTHIPVTPWLTFFAGLENILDYNYREHGSGINGPGRNLILTLELSR
jgi:outer membrane receptor protein involved in Fe transport